MFSVKDRLQPLLNKAEGEEHGDASLGLFFADLCM